MKIKYSKKWISIILGMVVVTVLLLLFMIPKKQGESISPRGVYRVEYYYVPLAQKLIYHQMKMPMTVRLYEVKTGRLISESAVVDLWLNGSIYWYLEPPMNSIMVGNDVIFENIPRECQDCPRLTLEQMTN